MSVKEKRSNLATRLAHVETELSDLTKAKDEALAAERAAAAASGGEGGVGALPEGWVEQQTAEGVSYYWNTATNLTSWERPRAQKGGGGGVSSAANAALTAKRTEARQMRDALREANDSVRELTITLFLTGCKPEEVEPQEMPKPGSIGEQINSLLSVTNPETGQPYVRIVAGRPEWDQEFGNLREEHKREEIGCVFCGAPAIAAALKAACQKHSDAVEGTIFKLHKENF